MSNTTGSLCHVTGVKWHGSGNSGVSVFVARSQQGVNMMVIKRRPGRPKKHSTKLVPVTGYVLPATREKLDLITNNIGEWIRLLIESKLS